MDGQIYAQPLYVSGLEFPDRGPTNTVFVATMHNTVYAIDAGNLSNGIPIWSVNFGPSVPASVLNCYDVYPEAGILSTPVIDLNANAIYVVSETLAGQVPVFRLHALSLFDGHEMFNGPTIINASVSGSAPDNTNNVVQFDPMQHLQRPGLLLANGAVYLGFGSHGDWSPWHGWLLAYDATDLTRQLAVFNATPNGGGGSVWHSGRGLAEDGGVIYAGTANGDYDGQNNLSNSFLKFSSGLKVMDWFTPNDWQALSDDDDDVASGGPALIPGTDLLLGGDKFGTLYLIHRQGMANLAQTFTVAAHSGIFSYALWPVPGNPIVYVQVQGDVLRAYSLAGGQFNEKPVALSTTYSDLPYQGIAVSSNGSGDGVVWMTTGDHSTVGFPGTLHAFDAVTLDELWNSDQVPGRDTVGDFAKFVPPTVVDGKVFVPTFSGHLSIYGPIDPSPAPGPILWSAANSASLIGDAVSPGEQVVLSGSNLLPAEGNVAVIFDDVSTRPLYNFWGQIGVIMPAFLLNTNTRIQVNASEGRSNVLTMPVQAATPGVYTADGSGVGLAQAYNEDGSSNSDDNPAQVGTMVYLVVNGAGQTNEQGAPLNPVSVWIGGVPADVLYSGPADDGTAGAVGVLVMIPGTVPTSNADVIVTVAGYSSQAGVWIAVL